MKISYTGYNVLVTGASNGIGKTIAEAYLRLGANVIGTSATKKSQKKKFKLIKVNFLIENEVNNFFQELKKISSIDILINNVGTNKINNISNVTDEDINDLIQVNLISSLKISREVSKKMIKYKYGKIVNISSIFGVVSKEKRSIYSATKFGLHGLTVGSSNDLARYNILVNTLSPGFVMTDLTRKNLSEIERTQLADQVPIKRLAEVQDISNVAIFLLSDLNRYMTGQNIIVDGGFTNV